jgi:hypothetical protein
MRYMFFFGVILILILVVSCAGRGSKLGGTDQSLSSQIGSTGSESVATDTPEQDDNGGSIDVTDVDDGYVAEDIAPPRDTFDVRLERLNAPTNVAASDNTYNDKVVITWNHPSGTAPTTYYIYRSETASNPSPTYLGGKTYPGTSYYDTTATPGTTYYYKLKSHKTGYNDSVFSNENAGTRSNRMNAPTGVTASDGLYNNKIAVTWTHPTGMTPLSYYIYRSTTASDPAPTFVGVKAYPANSINDTTAVYGTTYYYKIKSHKVGYNDSYFSNEDSGYMNNRMNAPTNVIASDGLYDDKVHITWNHPSQGVIPTSYYIYRSETQNNPSPTYIGARSYPGTYYDDTTATPDTTYYYKVKSHKSAYLDSYFSNENSGRIAIWFLETVDSADNVGAYPGITIDSGDNPHICYVDRTNFALKYAYFDGTSWHTETVDDTTEVTAEVTSIVLDSNDYPHISYVDQANFYLKYAYYNGATWTTETVDDSGLVNSGTSIALDSNNYPVIAYVDDSNAYLMLASNNGTEWFISTIDDTHLVDYYSPSLKLDSDNHPHIGYVDYGNGYLRYAYFDGTDWQYAIPDTTGGVASEYCSLYLDAAENPHFAYGCSSRLKYVFWQETAWNSDIVDNTNTSLSMSLALTSGGYACISYNDSTNKDLCFARFTGGSWELDTIDNTAADTGRFTSIALDSNNLPHICYYDNTNGDLRYANLS